MDLKRLEYFCSVANHMSFSKAAEEYRIAQTAMSRVIASMEEELGFQLFYRDHHRIELTAAGKSFLDFAVKMINDYSMATLSCSDIASGFKGRLTIGYGGFDLGFIKAFLPEYVRQYPEHSIVLKEYAYDDIVAALMSKECDVIFAPNARIGKQQSLRRIITSTCDNKIGVGRDHRLYNRTEVDPQELNGETFICAYDTIHSWHQLKQFERTCNIYGITPGRRLHTNTAGSLLSMVELGLGIAFLTDNVDLSGCDVHMLSINFMAPVRKTHVAASFLQSDNPAVNSFMDYLEKRLKQ
ncbi:MAG: LysR family transcriptional regulator [Firmicutes bacterium]|nr:LysR family transcriptional regulator [Bacillota bacterium]